MKRSTAVPVGLAAVLALSACSSSTSPSAPTFGVGGPQAPAAASTTPAPRAATTAAPSTSPPTTSATSTPSTSATSTPSTAATGATSSGADGSWTADVCAYLTGQVPSLRAIGSPVGRQANLAGNLFGFFQSHGTVPDGAALDATTTAQCPAVRAEILTLTGVSSLSAL